MPQLPCPNVTRPSRWTIADVLDFEALVAADRSAPEERLRERDQRLWGEQIGPALGPLARERRPVFHAWLGARRKAGDAVLPGEGWETGWQTVLTLAALLGALLGVSVCAGLLHYPGQEPINVLVFLGFTLAPQWALLIAGALLALERQTSGFLRRWRPLRALVNGAIAGTAALLGRMSGERRRDLRLSLARAGEAASPYRRLAGWPLLIVAQLFAVMFNLAVLGTLLVELPLRELRFGWQTTLNVGPPQLSSAVEALALPWRGWVPSPFPTPEQVEKTRYQPGQPHRELPGDALRSWWPFLCDVLLVYGLLPRVFLLFLGMAGLRRTLAGLSFDFPEAHQLWRRLTTPRLVESGGDVRLPARPVEEIPAPVRPAPEVVAPTERCFLVVAEELHLPMDEAQRVVRARYGWSARATRVAKIDNRGASKEVFAEIREAAGSLTAIVVLIPAARDPIVAVANFLREVSAAAGAAERPPEVLVHLLGGADARVDDARLEIWKRFRHLQSLAITLER